VRAQDYDARTDGDFNPAVYPLLKLWGLDAGSINFAHEEVPTPDEIAAVLPLCDYGKVEFYREDGLCYAKKAAGFEGLQLDFGAQSKGYITDRAIELFGAAGIAAASLNIGGNLYVYKSMPAEDMKSFSPWWVSVTDPAAADRRFVSLLCDDEAAVTSGDYERSFTLDGVVYPHILDPHSGIPIGVHYDETENRYVNDAAGLRSVTNFDPSAEKADVYATVGLLRGEARCLAMLEQMNAEDPLFKSLVFTYGTRMVYAAVGGLRRNPDRPGGSIGGYEPVRPGLVL
jgi:thiamine biosynthesis lipoprotein